MEYQQKTFVTLIIKEVAGLNESIKKGKFMTNLFQKMLNEVLKSCEK